METLSGFDFPQIINDGVKIYQLEVGSYTFSVAGPSHLSTLPIG
jgi:hypothetical protein